MPMPMPTFMTKYGAKAKTAKQQCTILLNMKAKFLGFILASAILGACDDNTGTLGILDDSDQITSSYTQIQMKTTTIQVDSIPAVNGTCYLGQVTDPETKTRIKADFLTQFHTMENYKLPAKSTLLNDSEGKVVADSIVVRLYFNDFYGDSTNVMKMNVYELDTLNVIEEGKKYYTNLDLSQFINAQRPEPIAQKVFTARDYTEDEGTLNGSNYYPNIQVKLPAEYGSFILNKYYEHPEYFKNSYEFIHHVCPGFYFNLTQGDGTMLYLDVSAMDIYFSYTGKSETTQKDTILAGVTRFAATGEVIQSNHMDVDGTKDLLQASLNSSHTYIKTPVGLYTQLELPINEIYRQHEQDSVSNVKLTLNRYNDFNTSHYALGIPQTLLLVRKKDMNSFFENRKTADNITSYTTSFNVNQYVYSNIARLISYCQQEKYAGMKETGLTEAEWERKNPDWNKAILIPVTTSNSQSSSSSSSARLLLDMKLNSMRLVGENQPISINVIYSKFSK